MTTTPPPHDHKGHSEEKCIRCGWVMGHPPLNCVNDDTPHVFPSQLEYDVRTWQEKVSAEARRRWPDITVMREALALVEEVGEIARCIVKRDEGTRGTPDEWTGRERLEIGQAMGVLLTVTTLEGFDIVECLEIAWQKMRDMPDRTEHARTDEDLADTLRAARDELKLHGWGDMHYGPQGQDRKIVAMVNRCNEALGDGPYDPDADRIARFGQ